MTTPSLRRRPTKSGFRASRSPGFRVVLVAPPSRIERCSGFIRARVVAGHSGGGRAGVTPASPSLSPRKMGKKCGGHISPPPAPPRRAGGGFPGGGGKAGENKGGG